MSTEPSKRRLCFADEIRPNLRFNRTGLLCMANQGPNTNTSQFFITLRDNDLEYLQDKHTIFGIVAEGLDTAIKAINEAEVRVYMRFS
jgi:peptidyl-prolyl cis-trans isomerase-like 4